MSAREMLLQEIGALDEVQIAEVLQFIRSCYGEIPNQETLAAIEESEQMLNDPKAKRFTSLDDLFEDLKERTVSEAG